MSDSAAPVSESIALLREACEGWPQPNPYDHALDVIETEIKLLRDQRDNYRRDYLEAI